MIGLDLNWLAIIKSGFIRILELCVVYPSPNSLNHVANEIFSSFSLGSRFTKYRSDISEIRLFLFLDYAEASRQHS